MKSLGLLVCLLAGSLVLAAQEQSATLDELIDKGRQWLEENIDESVLHSLGDVDEEKARRLLADLQKRFQGDYVVDLGTLKTSATALLTLLEAHEETLPYAEWLRAQLDYLDVADQFRLIIPAPKPEPGKPLRHAPNPTPELERKIWRKQLEKRPMPKGIEPYVTRLKPIFGAAGMPTELVWLAEVESGFRPRARSPVGAVGLFQLMPPTARSLGLLVGAEDQRLDPDKSGAAAARYLRYLYAKFKDWPLTLAAYNLGEGRLRALMERHQAKTFDQVSPYLPAETQMYVPRIEATLLRREGLSLAQIPAPQG